MVLGPKNKSGLSLRLLGAAFPMQASENLVPKLRLDNSETVRGIYLHNANVWVTNIGIHSTCLLQYFIALPVVTAYAMFWGLGHNGLTLLDMFGTWWYGWYWYWSDNCRRPTVMSISPKVIVSVINHVDNKPLALTSLIRWCLRNFICSACCSL